MREHETTRGCTPARRGYTLVELVFTITVITVLMALTLVFIGGSVRQARVVSERLFMASLRLGVEQFEQSFGFLPPLIDDGNPYVGTFGGVQVNIRGAGTPNDLGLADRFLQDGGGARYSVLSLPTYLLGTAPAIVDGYEGVGQGKARADGTWDTAAPRNEPFVDVSRDAERLQPFGSFTGFSTLLDRWGNSIRYYRWSPTLEPKYLDGGVLNPAVGEILSHNVPAAVLDAGELGQTIETNAGTGMRSGLFAIVSAGPDGLIGSAAWSSRDAGGHDPVLSSAPKPANRDNIVEVGR
ncbi:MAG: type II secretion system protein [Phycisphaerales bacterium]